MALSRCAREKIAAAILFAGALLALSVPAFWWHWMIWGPHSDTIGEGIDAFTKVMLICLVLIVPSAILMAVSKAILKARDNSVWEDEG